MIFLSHDFTFPFAVFQRSRLSSINVPLPPIPKDAEEKPALEKSEGADSEKPEEHKEEIIDEDSDVEFEFDEDNKPIWDMFQLIPRDRVSPTETYEGMLKGLRVFLYFFLFLFVWVSATGSVACFLLLIGVTSKGHAKVQKCEE